MSSKTPITFLPLSESLYLARPAKLTSNVALQAQHLNPTNSSVEPMFDVKINSHAMSKIMKKVRSLNDAVSSIIPEPPLAHHHYQRCKNSVTALAPNLDLSPLTSSFPLHFAETKSSKIQSFSVFDRDSNQREPIAVISRNEINFSPRATPLLTKSSRLDRLSNYSSEFAGEVCWTMVPEFGSSNKNKITSFKVIDQSTNKVIGRWKRRSTLTKDLEPADVFSNQENVRESFQSLGTTASNRYYLSDAKTAISHPFFSGEAYSFVKAGSKTTEEWCFVVTKRYTKHGKSTFKRNVMAVLKGFELNIVDPHDTTLRHYYLDEYMRHLREKVMNGRAELTSVFSRNHIHSGEEDNEEEEESFSVAGSPPYSSHRMSQIRSDSSSPPNNRNSSFAASGSMKMATGRDSTFSENFYRLRINDGLVMVSMALLLNLDEIILSGIRSKDTVDLPSSLSNGSSRFSDNYVASPMDWSHSSPVASPALNSMKYRDSFDEEVGKEKRVTRSNSKILKKLHLGNPLHVFRKEASARV